MLYHIAGFMVEFSDVVASYYEAQTEPATAGNVHVAKDHHPPFLREQLDFAGDGVEPCCAVDLGDFVNP